MKQTFRRIGENFYQRSYMTAQGERVKYYAVFTDWRGIRRRFALGSDKQLARQRLRIRLGSNAKETDFDIEPKQKLAEKERLTLSQWGAIYFGEIIQPDKRSLHWQKRMFTKLESRLGNMFLDDIDESVLDSYKNTRLREPIVKGRTVLKGTKVSFSTVNRELAILRTLLRQAKRWKQIKTVPEFILESEKSRKRNRIASQEEYEALLAIMERHDQRLLIGHYETAMRASELLKLTWDKVSEKDGFIRLKAADTKEKRPRSVPISQPLQEVLTELRNEQKRARVVNLSGRVFTQANGQPIKSLRFPFERACRKAEIKDLHIHDFRHTCITRWAMEGKPIGAIMAASGHHSVEMHDRYVNLQEHHLKAAFEGKTVHNV